MPPELRLIRYFVAVAEEQHFTRAAKRLHMAQPPLSAAIRQLEQQLGVALLARQSRGVRLTPAGELLLIKGRALLAAAADVASEVRAVESSPSGLLHVGFTPAARYGLSRTLIEQWSSAAPGVMVRTHEDTTGTLIQDLTEHKLDLALVFCPPPIQGLSTSTIDEPAVVHLQADHPLADRRQLSLDELREETFLVAGGKDSDGYTAAVIAACEASGFAPRTRPDPYPDLGIQAVREGLGIVLYARSGFPSQLEGTTLVPVVPDVALPFVLVWRDDGPNARLRALLEPTVDRSS